MIMKEPLKIPCPSCGKPMLLSFSAETKKLKSIFCYTCKVVTHPINRERLITDPRL